MSAGGSHLLGRLAVVELRVRTAVERRRAVDPDPDDGFRGLYLADHHVDELLAGPRPLLTDDPAGELRAQVEAAAPAGSPLRQLRSAFGLSDLDVELLLIALAPDLDPRFEKLYGYLHDDVTQKRASTGLALELAGCSPTDAGPRSRLAVHAPLVAGRLVTVEGTGTFLRRPLSVPDRVLNHLLGHDELEPQLVPLVAEVHDVPEARDAALGRALAQGCRLVHLQESPGSAPRELAVSALADAGLDAIVLDLDRLTAGDDAVVLAALAGREALLRGAGLVAGPVEVLSERGVATVRAWAELPCPTLLHGPATWDPAWSRQVTLLAPAETLPPSARDALWASSLAGAGATGVDATRQFRFGPDGLVRAARAARQQSLLDGGAVDRASLLAGARSQNAVGLERLARRISPDVGWDDLVLPDVVSRQIRELAARARNREVVLDDWTMRPGGGRGRGITALFAGESGTGKTLAAEVVAAELGLDLYTVDLATVVDKYIGETEKNLERIFGQADGVNGVLLFDEADALFGKRSEVKDARDRYANIEVAYLLQRMESFNGLAILATNLRTNLDDAFSRRLDAIIDFPDPDADSRERLWDLCLGTKAPRGDDIDLRWLAEAFELAGGHIRSICTSAAYLAADAGRPIDMRALVGATQAEYRKLGRLILSAEFGAHLDRS